VKRRTEDALLALFPFEYLAIREQQKQIEQQRTQVDLQEKEIEGLKRLIRVLH